MDERKLQDAGIDYDAALARFVGKREIYEKYLTKFLEDTHVQDALSALEKKDYGEVLEQTHALKGLAGTLGMTELFEVSADIVRNLRNEVWDGLEDKLYAMKEVKERLCDVIRTA